MSTSGLGDLRRDRRGMTSLMVTLAFIIIISLIAIGFSFVARNNARQALDRQLSTQAFYAAEAGINDAVAYLKANPTSAGSKDSCDVSATGYARNAGVVDADSGTRYTCMLVDPTPPNLSYDNVSDKSIVVPVERDGGAAIGDIEIAWRRASGDTGSVNSCTAAVGSLPMQANWSCPYGMIRVDVLPASSLTNAATAAQNAMTFFAWPGTPASSIVSRAYNNQADSNRYNSAGPAYQGGSEGLTQCESAADGVCRFRITNLDFARAYLRIRTVYKSTANLVIDGYGGGATADFANAQAIVDVTGRAQDVLRRVQVRVPLNGETGTANAFPEFAIQSNQDLCKTYVVAPLANVSRDPDNCRGL